MSHSTAHLDIVLGREDIDPARLAAQTEWKLHELNRRFALVNWGGNGAVGKQTTLVFERDADTGAVLSLREFDDFRKHPELVSSTISYVEERVVRNQTVQVVQTAPIVPYWLHYPFATKFNRLVFAPPGSTEIERDDDYRLWHGFAVEGKAGKWPKVRAFIRDTICNGNTEHEAWLHQWIAAMIQKPGQHAWTAPMLLGGQGIGKGFFVSTVLSKLFRDDNYLHLMNSAHVNSDFNAFLGRRVLIFADEAFWGDRKSANLLKGKITEDTVMINPKYLPQEVQKSCLHIIIASNSPEPVHIEHDDRRYFVLRVSERRKKDVKYFAGLEKELDNGGREAMFDYFNTVSIDWDVLWTAPESAAKAELKSASLDPQDEWWQDELSEAGAWNTDRPKNGVVTSYLDFMKKYDRRAKKMNATHLGRWLSGHFTRGGMKGWPKSRRDPKPSQEYRWVFPSLEDCRKVFDTATGTRNDWEGGDPDAA